jgi:hypothetical protein
MPWVQSHSDLRHHPKLKRAARAAGCSPVQMSGHLHWLWWWALDIAPDGDLSPYDPDDIADAAGWEGDAGTFVRALMDCGPGDKAGFLDPDMRLHDWEQYGGKYRKRSEAGRKAASARWHSEDNAVSEPANANALQTHCDGNAEERRGEERKPKRGKANADRTGSRPRNELWDAVVQACGWDAEPMTKSQQGRTAAAVKELREIGASPDEIKRRAGYYRVKYPGMDLTPTALSANWASIAQPPSGHGRVMDVGTGGVFFND